MSVQDMGNSKLRVKFEHMGLKYVFVMGEEDEGEPVLTYVGTDSERLSPSIHAVPSAWKRAKELMSS